jgi:hypothetical protein
MKEIWKDIKGYEGIYQISSFGRVKSLNRIDEAGYNRKEKLLTPATNGRDKYLYVGLSFNKVRKTLKIHRLVAQAFIPNLENKPEVNHIDSNKQNNNFVNLEWTTSRENVTHLNKTICEKYTSKYTGVHWRGNRKRWVATIFIDGKLKYLGSSKDEKYVANLYQIELQKINNNNEK